MQSGITGSFWAKILIIADVSSICDTHSIPNTSCVSIYLNLHDNWMGWSRYDYLSHCRSEKGSGRRVETVAFCLLVSSHRLDWGGQRWVNLRLMAWRLHFWVSENRESIKHKWLQFTHSSMNSCSSFLMETCSQVSQNPWKLQWVPQGSRAELMQDPGNGKP